VDVQKRLLQNKAYTPEKYHEILGTYLRPGQTIHALTASLRDMTVTNIGRQSGARGHNCREFGFMHLCAAEILACEVKQNYDRELCPMMKILKVVLDGTKTKVICANGILSHSNCKQKSILQQYRVVMTRNILNLVPL
jgi:hypothetical protein